LARFANDESVLFWHLGDWRSNDEIDAVARTATAVRTADPKRPVAADVRDDFQLFSRRLDLIGAHRWPLMTSMELTQYREWLEQRRVLPLPHATFFWTWVQTHLPDWYLNVVQPPRNAAGFTEPIGPLSEQIRLLTYVSLAAGSRGIAYYSDRYLADSHQGRD